MKGLSVGQCASRTRTFTAVDVAAYRQLAGDVGVGFGREDAMPGPLLGGMISELLGTTLPGRGTNWLKQQLMFVGAAAVGTAVTASVTVTRLRPEKALVNLRTTCADAAGNLICEGEALVLVSDLTREVPM